MGHFWKGRCFQDKCIEIYSTFEVQVGFLLWGTLCFAALHRQMRGPTVGSVGKTSDTVLLAAFCRRVSARYKLRFLYGRSNRGEK